MSGRVKNLKRRETRISFGIVRKFILLIFSTCLLHSSLDCVIYSAFIPELTYTQYASSVSDNYTQPEPRELPIVADSIWWEIPVRSWDTFKRFNISLWSPYTDTNCIFRYRYKNQGLDFYNRSNFLMGYDGTFSPGKQYNLFYIGFNQQAWLNRRWSFHSQFTYNSLRGDSLKILSSPFLDSHWKYYGRHFEFGNVTAGINYEDNIIKASLGRGRLNMGNSITGSILLSDRVNDYGYLSADFQVGNFIISLMNAQLVADSTLTAYGNPGLDNRNYPEKYFVAHQFTWLPVHQFALYAGETLVYGNSSLNLNYLLPQAYFRVMADSDHDRDNATMYAGFEWTLKEKWLFYFTYMMDEFRPERLLKEWWGNKYAFQGGLSYKLPLEFVPDKPLRLTAEMTAIRPWTYTHDLMYDKYSHDNRCLGFPYGANLLHYATRLDIQLPMDCNFSGYLSYMRQGTGPATGPESVGDNFLTNTSFIDEQFDSYYYPASWLQGDIVNTIRIENSIRIGIIKHHRLFLSQMSEKKSGVKWSNQVVFGWQLVY
jgi:hypothetical protein